MSVNSIARKYPDWIMEHNALRSQYSSIGVRESSAIGRLLGGQLGLGRLVEMGYRKLGAFQHGALIAIERPLRNLANSMFDLEDSALKDDEGREQIYPWRTTARDDMGFTYYLTVIDCFSKWIEATPFPDIQDTTIADAFYTSWITRFGVPSTIISDQELQFEPGLFPEHSW
ncbi:hypothetical protein NPIL_665801 [Nephila pilipes]|uniref:Integrase catalytic domain-containing protein n=1 Tax=Nephila pilipes TaxID=299642 RepID=A0A8X6NIQ7_NEPPI|nr:hypothetical protein NPIL_665801 [Nephila pilipes]